jgi:hypothetical protein
LQLIAELEIHRDSVQEELLTDIFTDDGNNPNPAPATTTIAAPVDGMLVLPNAETVEDCNSGTFTTDMLLTIKTNEIKMPDLLRIEGNTLAKMRESHSQIVKSAEENLLNNRNRTLESHTPNLAPSTVTIEAAVISEANI